MSLPNLTDIDFVEFSRFETVTVRDGAVFVGADPFVVTSPVRGVIRVQLGNFDAPDYGMITAPETAPLSPTVQDDGTLSYTSGDVELRVLQQPVRLELWRAGQCILQPLLDEHFRGWSRLPTLARREQDYTFAFELGAEEPVYGFGEKFGPLNKRGALVRSYVEDALGVNTELSYKNTPFCWSPKGWGIYINTPSTVTHGVGYGPWSHRAYAAVVDEPRLDLCLMAAETPAEVLTAYTDLCGKAPAVPLWSYGVWVSRAYYRTSEEIEAAAAELREKDFPSDVITFDGRAWLDTPTRFNFKWDETRYPDPKAVMDRLKDKDFHICNWEYPLVSIHAEGYEEMAEKGWFLKTQTGETYVYYWDTDAKTSPFGSVLTPLPPSGILDFTHPDAYAYWRDSHEALFAQGVDVMKVDFGEQVPFDAVASNGDTGRRLHSVYAMLYNKCIYEASVKFKGDDACLWARASWAGSHRYPLQWGGDPQSDWGGLSGSIRGGLSWGMSAAPYHATDVGGFYGKEQPKGDLYLRWVQFSAFSSHFRIHGIGEREPWCFGPEAEKIARQWFKLRYRLIPYLKAAGDQAQETSLPVMRAMALAFPADRLARGFEHQFMCGDSLLIAPVITADPQVEIWLPSEERWTDIWTGETYEGGQMITVTAADDLIPVFLRDGHVLPLGPVVSSTKELPAEGVITEVIMPNAEATVIPAVYGDALSLTEGTVTSAHGQAIAVSKTLSLPA